MGSTTSRPAPTTVDIIDEKRQALEDLASRTRSLRIVDHTLPNRSQDEASATIRSSDIDQWQDLFETDQLKQLGATVLSYEGDPPRPCVTLTSRTLTSSITASAQKADPELRSCHRADVGYSPSVRNSSSAETHICQIFKHDLAANLARRHVMKRLDVADFELSQPYLALYDKLEKANYFLENIIELRDEHIDSRLLQVLFKSVGEDGGQFHFLQNLLMKYGAMPKACFPETFNSSHTARLNKLLVSKLRQDALDLKATSIQVTEALDATGVSDPSTRSRAIVQACRAKKEMQMAEVYSVIAIAAGGSLHRPDESFTFDFETTSGKVQTITSTPLEFFAKYCAPFDPSDCVSLTNDPRNPYSCLMTVDRLNNMAGEQAYQARYINTSPERLIDIVKAQIDADQQVWFGCDSGQYGSRDLGIWDTEIANYESAFGISLNMNKRERLETAESAMDHAMCITAYHTDADGNVLRFRIENSWGPEVGNRGWFLCTTSWFKAYVFQIVAPKRFVPKDLLDVYEKGTLTVLPRWDPMGTLA